MADLPVLAGQLERWAAVLANDLSVTEPDTVPLSSGEAHEVAALLRSAAGALRELTAT